MNRAARSRPAPPVGTGRVPQDARDAPGLWEAFRPAVQAELDAFYDSSRSRAAGLSTSFVDFCDALEASLHGGKWVRPRLVHLAYSAYGGTDLLSCARLAASFEVLHSALVVHDDVIDRDFVRRGRPNVAARYRDVAASKGLAGTEAEHAGQSAAVIAGDLLLVGAVQLAGRAALHLPQGSAVVDVVHDAIFSSAAGELDDLLFSLDPDSADLQRVLDMERLKTASYSFEAPLRAGGLLAGASAAEAEALAGIGRNIGVAYQVVDDVLGTFGESATTGKSVDSDLREGKRTILTAYASTVCDFAPRLSALRSGDIAPDQLREELRAAGAESYALDLASGLVSAALDQAAGLGLPPAVRSELTRICHHVLHRER